MKQTIQKKLHERRERKIWRERLRVEEALQDLPPTFAEDRLKTALEYLEKYGGMFSEIVVPEMDEARTPIQEFTERVWADSDPTDDENVASQR